MSGVPTQRMFTRPTACVVILGLVPRIQITTIGFGKLDVRDKPDYDKFLIQISPYLTSIMDGIWPNWIGLLRWKSGKARCSKLNRTQKILISSRDCSCHWAPRYDDSIRTPFKAGGLHVATRGISGSKLSWIRASGLVPSTHCRVSLDRPSGRIRTTIPVCVTTVRLSEKRPHDPHPGLHENRTRLYRGQTRRV